MQANDTVDELLLSWEAARQLGRKLTVEELCGDRPHLADELRRRIRVITLMEDMLGVVADDPHRTMHVTTDGASAEQTAEPLPSIPGYELLRVIGRGGMGVVYEARQVELGRTVAIKMISAGRLGPKVVGRFRREAKAAAELHHPNFVQIYEVGQVNGQPYFTMEYVAGGSLAELLTKQPPTHSQTATLLATLARAIHAAHERGIVHRDLKPSNVMLTVDGVPKIADFGLAKRLDHDAALTAQTHTGEILGTPSYMAPEQAEGRQDLIGPATDIYALGAILYDLLTGQPPFQGATPLASLRLVLAHELRPPSQLKPAVPRDLEAICLKCLEREPNKRYTSALALAEDLQRFLDGKPVLARHSGWLLRAWKWARRHPQGAAWCAVAAALALVPVYLVIDDYRTQRAIVLNAEKQAPLAREILQRNCFECHGHGKNVEGDLHILEHQNLLDSVRKIVVAGKPEDSRLIQRITDGSMPPEEQETRLPRLSEKELVILREWILGGAPPFGTGDDAQAKLAVTPPSELAARVKSIFIERCYECHNFDKPKNGIKILHHRLLVNVRKVVVPGQPEESELYQLLKTPNEKKRMPSPPYDRLPPAEIATIRDWILEGALPFPKTE